MSSSDGLTLALVALFVVMIVSLLVAAARVEIAKKRGAKTPAVTAPTRPVPMNQAARDLEKTPVTHENRAIRDSYAALLKNTDPVEVAKQAERFAPQLVDALQRIGELARYDRRTQP